MSQATDAVGLKPRLGLFGATMIGVGAMVGAGIFVLCGVAMKVAGPSAILAFGLNGLVTLITAFAFAELAATFPEAGGGYVFAKKVFAIGPAFSAGWVLWFAYVVACSLYALGFAGFLEYTIVTIGGESAAASLPAGFTVAIALVSVLAGVVLLGTRGAGAGNLISVLKVVAFGILIVLGVMALSKRPVGTVDVAFEPFMPFGFGGVLAAMGFTFIALEGYEIIAAMSEEITDARKTVPRAMFLSIGITLLVYMGLLFVLLTAGGPSADSPAWKDLGERGDMAVAVAAERFGGGFGGAVVLAAGLLATFSALTATLLAASRISFAMARDRALPRRLRDTSGKQNTPMPALIVSGLLAALVIVLTGEVEIAGAAASLIFLLSFALANGAGLLVRARVGVGEGFKAPFYPVLPLLGMACCLGLAIFQALAVPEASAVVLGWFAVGGMFYVMKMRRSAETASALSETVDSELIRLRGRQPLVLVPIANPDRAEPLVKLASALAAPGIGRVLTLTVAGFDPHKPETGVQSYQRVEGAIQRAVTAASELGRPYEGVVILAQDPIGTITRTAAERKPEVILLGMSAVDQGDKGTEVLERIISNTNADIVVMMAPRGWTLDSVSKVLLPVSGWNPNNPLRARVLGMLLRGGERTAQLLRVLRPGEERGQSHRELLREADDLGLSPENCLIEESSDAAATIVERSKEYDLIILGLPRGQSRRRLIGDFALAVAGGAHCPVIAIAQSQRALRAI